MDQSKHFWSIKFIFRSIENRNESFLKNFCFHVVSTISNFFKSLFSLIRSVKSIKAIFCRFPLKILQGFSPLRPVRPFYPSFCIYFHVSCIKSCILGKFRTKGFLGFFMIQVVFLKIDQWDFVIRCYITVLDGLIWSIWWFVRNWKL